MAFAGLGLMGTAMTERLLAAGYSLLVYNRTVAKTNALAARGASVAKSAAELLATASVCVSSLADDAALEEVAAAIFDGARTGTVLVDTSTVSPASSARVAASAADAGVLYLRAPVAGTPVVVRAGNLTLMVSGPPEAFARVEELLRAIGPNVYYVGEHDEARVVKLALQVIIGGTGQLLAEALVLGEARGVGRRLLLEVLGDSAAGSPFVKFRTEPLLRDDYTATVTVTMVEKDIDLVRALAADVGVPLPLTSALKELLAAATAGGYAELDFMALFLQLRRAAGLDAQSGTYATPSSITEQPGT